MVDTRAEGVYLHWTTYPEGLLEHNNILVIERVNGDSTVTKIEVTRKEAQKISNFLILEDLTRGGIS